MADHRLTEKEIAKNVFIVAGVLSILDDGIARITKDQAAQLMELLLTTKPDENDTGTVQDWLDVLLPPEPEETPIA